MRTNPNSSQPGPHLLALGIAFTALHSPVLAQASAQPLNSKALLAFGEKNQHANVEREKFDTDEAYEARLKKLDRAFRVTVPVEPHEVNYDAALKGLRVTFIPDRFPVDLVFARNSGLPAFRAAPSDFKQGTYVGQNAFGASTRVSTTQTTTWSVVHFGRYLHSITHQQTIEPAAAEKLSKRLVWQLEGKTIAAPELNGVARKSPTSWILYGSHLSAATISAPSEFVLRRYGIPSILKEVALVDRVSGEVLQRAVVEE